MSYLISKQFSVLSKQFSVDSFRLAVSSRQFSVGSKQYLVGNFRLAIFNKQLLKFFSESKSLLQTIFKKSSLRAIAKQSFSKKLKHATLLLGSFFLFLASFTIQAQTKLSSTEALTLKNKIIEVSKNTQTIANDFKQSKHLSFLAKDIISYGKLVFKAPNLIKWEYQKPFKYSVIFKDNQLFINDDGIKSDIDLSANKAFKNLNNLIIQSVKGDMFDDEKFIILYFKQKANYLVRFTSIDKSLKSFIKEFELIFDSKSFHVLSIKMIESSEDFTTIEFLNQKINKPVADAIFAN